jgi:hypothetical protein
MHKKNFWPMTIWPIGLGPRHRHRPRPRPRPSAKKTHRPVTLMLTNCIKLSG